MRDAHDLYLDFLGLNQDAFGLRLSTSSYHALSGAMYCALDLKDKPKLLDVQRLARKQLEELTVVFAQSSPPPSVLMLYESLVRLVAVHCLIVEDK